ncbi:hypothetical protein IGK47_000345 [Enterococcus sp. AZ007]
MAVQLIKKGEFIFIMKKTKLMVAGLMISTMLLGGVSSAFATESTGTIEFTENKGGGDPSDPEEPDEKNPDPVKPTPEVGPLILKVVPIFDFGSHEVNQAGGTYDDTETVTNYLEVRDNRDAGMNGWSVTASRTEFTSGSKSLTGSALALPKGVVRNSIANATQGNTATTDAIADDTILATAATIPLTGSTVEVLKTVKRNDLIGKGNTTSNIAETTPASLTVAPGTAAIGTFTSTITWTVTAAP